MDNEVLDAATSSSFLGGPSFTLRNRISRAIFGLVWAVFASWTPPPLHAWRVFLLRCFGAKIGRAVRVYGSAKIWHPANLAMGDYSVMGWDVVCYNQAPILVEEHAIVSQYAHLVAGTHDVDSPYFQLHTKPIRIGRWAWVASDAFVGPGVSVGEGAVLGGRGVAFKDLDEWTVYAGNPCKVIKKRRRIAH